LGSAVAHIATRLRARKCRNMGFDFQQKQISFSSTAFRPTLRPIQRIGFPPVRSRTEGWVELAVWFCWFLLYYSTLKIEKICSSETCGSFRTIQVFKTQKAGLILSSSWESETELGSNLVLGIRTRILKSSDMVYCEECLLGCGVV
jgi:hypothetical protein